MAATAELGDKAVTMRDCNVIDAAAAVTGAHSGLGGEHIAAAGRRDEDDVAPGSHGDWTPAVAGAGERGVREAEDQTPVTDAVAVDHVVPHRHPGPGPARPVTGQLYAKHPRRGVGRHHRLNRTGSLG